MQHSFKKGLIYFLFILLCLPFIQRVFHPVHLKPLSGAVITEHDTAFTFKGWFSGRYQFHKEKAINDSFGLREFFINVNNQLEFDLFKKAHAEDITIGKENELFGTEYLDAYSGKDFAGEERIRKRLSQLKIIQNYLDSLHKTFILVFAPSKARYYPEYIPDTYPYSQKTNYSISAEIARENCLNVIDFNKYFAEAKSYTPYPLFSHNGNHWTKYGACLAADSIIHYIEHARNIRMRHPNWKKVVIEPAMGDELELANEMNVILPFKKEKLAHPILIPSKDSTAVKPTLLFIGDSFFWGLAVHFNFWDMFRKINFCYYYRELYGTSGNNLPNMEKFDLKDTLYKTDVVIVEATEKNLAEPGWGFEAGMLKIIHPETGIDTAYHQKINKVKNYIKLNPAWLKREEEKAEESKISLDSMLTEDAIWMIEHQKN